MERVARTHSKLSKHGIVTSTPPDRLHDRTLDVEEYASHIVVVDGMYCCEHIDQQGIVVFHHHFPFLPVTRHAIPRLCASGNC